jgi:UDP-N-acetylmuramoyl-tripeptide--D-alanyl-D-alanine ligase
MATPIPKNTAAFTLAEIMAATGGAIRGALADDALSVAGLETDTRRLVRGEAFVALAGERFDGHHHLAEAAAQGASLAIVEREAPAPPGLTTLRVGSSLAALGELAAWHLERWHKRAGGRVLALTGSAGKTTTKAAVAALAAAARPGLVHATAGNLNNLVGVPMTVLALPPAARFLVLELGTNQRGEIAKLARMTRPDVAIVTLVAAAHTAGLGSVEDVAREKGALFEALGATGVAIGNADDARVARALARAPAGTRLRYGLSEAADYRVIEQRLVAPGRTRVVLSRGGEHLEVETPLAGRAGALALAAALAGAEALLGCSLGEGELARMAFTGADLAGRMQPRQARSGLWLVDDSYNANPASCRASIEAAAELAAHLGRRLVLVLGEMRELGAVSASEHAALGDVAAKSGAALLVAVGGDAEATAHAGRDAGLDARFVASAALAAETAVTLVDAGDVVLVKGSRGVGNEAVVRALWQAHESEGGAA